MDTIRIEEINNYTTKCIIDGMEFTLTDTKIRETSHELLKYEIYEAIGLVGCFVFMLIILGTIGHSDYFTKAPELDPWTAKEYILVPILAAIGVVISHTTFVKAHRYFLRLKKTLN